MPALTVPAPFRTLVARAEGGRAVGGLVACLAAAVLAACQPPAAPASGDGTVASTFQVDAQHTGGSPNPYGGLAVAEGTVVAAATDRVAAFSPSGPSRTV